MTTLIIARHGNTFEAGDTPRRVGARTDIPLVDSGREQARAIGRYLKNNRLIPDVVYASELQRTQETAQIAIAESGVSNPVYTLDIFNEIDYGPDENKTAAEVTLRIGAQAIKDWDQKCIVPPDWNVDTDAIIKNWLDFADHIRQHEDNETVMVVTSNGIARFAIHLAPNVMEFKKNNAIKLSTGAIAILKHIGDEWVIHEWNIKP
ncbi:MAG: histidine phosphatase family protein [Alphaproteobacteria bacterium]